MPKCIARIRSRRSRKPHSRPPRSRSSGPRSRAAGRSGPGSCFRSRSRPSDDRAVSTVDSPLAPATSAPLPDDVATLIGHELAPHFPALSACRSTSELQALPLYRELARQIDQALATPHVGSFAAQPGPAKERYRCVAWNLERGIHLPGQVIALREHPYLRESDLLLLTEADAGMARSGNHDVARELAAGLGMHYAFLPCYLNLSKGAGLESEVDGRNRLGLHGNALLARYPIRNVRRIGLVNGIDKMAGREKRLGTQ